MVDYADYNEWAKEKEEAMNVESEPKDEKKVSIETVKEFAVGFADGFIHPFTWDYDEHTGSAEFAGKGVGGIAGSVALGLLLGAAVENHAWNKAWKNNRIAIYDANADNWNLRSFRYEPINGRLRMKKRVK